MMGLAAVVLGVLILGIVAVGVFRMVASPGRARPVPCPHTDVPGVEPKEGDDAGVRSLLLSFGALGFQPSGAIRIDNPPVPPMFVVLLTRKDGSADARIWVQFDGTPGTTGVGSLCGAKRIYTSSSAAVQAVHDGEEVDSVPDGSPMALVHRHEDRIADRGPETLPPEGAARRFLDDWNADLAALERKSWIFWLVARTRRSGADAPPPP